MVIVNKVIDSAEKKATAEQPAKLIELELLNPQPEEPTTKVVTTNFFKLLPQPEELTTKVADFEQCISAIAQNRGKLILVGRAFQIIHNHWKDWGNQPWGTWCRSTWNWSTTYVNYLMGQADVASQLKLPDDFPSNTLRPLTGLTAEHRQEAWDAAMATTRDGHPSAAAIEMAASKFKDKPIADWNMRAAQALLGNAVKRGVERALATATPEQQAEFLAALPELFDHYKAVLSH